MEKKCYPWGVEKFEAANTYAPAFHQPRRLKNLDHNTAGLQLEWDSVVVPTRQRSMAEEMQETLDKINDLLCQLKGNSTSAKPPTPDTQLPSQIRSVGKNSATLNSDLESLSRDISTMTAELKSKKEQENSKIDGKREVGVGFSEPIRSRAVSTSSNTINSCFPSLRSSQNTQEPSTTTAAAAAAAAGGETAAPRKRTISQSSGSYFRGSLISQQHSLHKSSFKSIAGLCGLEDDSHTRMRQDSEASSVHSLRVSDNTTLRRGTQRGGVGEYFTEYPPQKGGSTFQGIFEHDISGLMDESARGLITF